MKLPSFFEEDRLAVEDALDRLMPAAAAPPPSIHEAMRYSVFAGGKRIRPILCLESARIFLPSFTLDDTPALHPACAIEFIHTYSLIHDDLPALDNDDLRRGKPTAHVVYGEATAILAGDALQTLAFQTIAALPTAPVTAVAILREVSLAIGTGVGRVGDLNSQLPPGMIGGQVMDIESEGVPPTADLVETIHRAKTGALFVTAAIAGAVSARTASIIGATNRRTIIETILSNANGSTAAGENS